MSSVSREDELDERRRQIIEVAAAMLVAEGAHGLSLRQLAREVGGSTQLIYTLFGGKPGLADALYGEGFCRLGDAMAAAAESGLPAGDPGRIIAMGHAYRDFARNQPALFSVMFGRAIPGFTPVRRTRHEGRSVTFGHVVTTVQQCLDAGTLAGADSEEIARICWLTAHGLASLEAAGLLAVDDHLADVALRVPIDAYRPAQVTSR